MGNEMVANEDGMLYPFFAIQFLGDAVRGDTSMWTAAQNWNAAASAACVNMGERLNDRLMNVPHNQHIDPLNTCAFSMTICASEAELWVTWKEGDSYIMQILDRYLLLKPRDYDDIRNRVRDVLWWGSKVRMQDFTATLDFVTKVSRRLSCPSGEWNRRYLLPGQTGLRRRRREYTHSDVGDYIRYRWIDVGQYWLRSIDLGDGTVVDERVAFPPPPAVKQLPLPSMPPPPRPVVVVVDDSGSDMEWESLAPLAHLLPKRKKKKRKTRKGKTPVTKASTPVVTMASTPIITISSPSPVVTRASTPVVTKASAPVVTMASTPVVTIASTPVVTMASTPVVTMASTPIITITSPPPDVTMAGT
jgi:hypothetical protein